MTRQEAMMELRKQILKCEAIARDIEHGFEDWSDRIKASKASIRQNERQIAKVF